MSDIAIRVEHLGKQYRIGALRQNGGRYSYKSLRETIASAASAPLSAFRSKADPQRHSNQPTDNHFWALQDISFDLKQGEVLGIIGHNGAGKSTLLKILSRITEPTTGIAEIHGRVASLLEVGTGFHPELTGRENIFLNGAILGMKKADIVRKFDDIVCFAEVGKFIDTPVKHYSSGMYVRLAFAVAAHLEPEVLVVDEVLSVGDVEFQKKCLGKMESWAHHEGRTVLFVSHNMQSINTLCSKAILLRSGRKALEGETKLVIDQYLSHSHGNTSLVDFAAAIRALPEDETLQLRDIAITQSGKSTTHLVSGEPLTISIEYTIRKQTAGFHIWLSLYDADGTFLFETLHNGSEASLPLTHPGFYMSRATIPADLLAGKTYHLEINAAIHRVRTCIPQPTPFRIPLTVTDVGLVNRAYPGYVTPAKLAPLIPWHTSVLQTTD